MPISGGSNLLAVYSANASAVVLAFGGTNATLANVTAGNPLETDAFYKGAFSDQGNGSVDPLLADPFYGRIGGGYDGLYTVRCRHMWQTPQGIKFGTVARLLQMSQLWYEHRPYSRDVHCDNAWQSFLTPQHLNEISCTQLSHIFSVMSLTSYSHRWCGT